MRDESGRTTGKCVEMTCAPVSNHSDMILTVIQQEYGSLRHAAKILATHAKASYRTAEGWLSGRSVPTGDNLVNLIIECDALADEINQLVAVRRASKDTK